MVEYLLISSTDDWPNEYGEPRSSELSSNPDISIFYRIFENRPVTIGNIDIYEIEDLDESDRNLKIFEIIRISKERKGIHEEIKKNDEKIILEKKEKKKIIRTINLINLLKEKRRFYRELIELEDEILSFVPGRNINKEIIKRKKEQTNKDIAKLTQMKNNLIRKEDRRNLYLIIFGLLLPLATFIIGLWIG